LIDFVAFNICLCAIFLVSWAEHFVAEIVSILVELRLPIGFVLDASRRVAVAVILR